MERRKTRIDKDYMKMVMLKQDETFRDQVHELHRIYRRQKLLMSKAKNAGISTRQTLTQSNSEIWNAETERASSQTCFDFLDQRHPENDYKPAGVTVQEADEERGLELTLAAGGGSCVRQAKTKEELFTSESGSSFSSSSTDSDFARKSSNEWWVNQKPDASLMFRKDTEEGISKDGLKNSPWLFQLDLNFTT